MDSLPPRRFRRDRLCRRRRDDHERPSGKRVSIPGPEGVTVGIRLFEAPGQLEAGCVRRSSGRLDSSPLSLYNVVVIDDTVYEVFMKKASLISVRVSEELAERLDNL